MELENALYETDEYLKPYKTDIIRRHDQFTKLLEEIEKSEGLEVFSKSYEKFGLHVNEKNEVIGYEWVPGAEALFLRGDFNQWKRTEFQFEKMDFGKWKIVIPPNADGTCRIPHNSKIKLVVLCPRTGEMLDRISPWAEYVFQGWFIKIL